MNVFLWIVAVVLALVFLAAGLSKVLQPKERLVTRMAWATDVSQAGIKLVGLVEVLGAIGLVLPALTGIAPVLVPLAATGLALTMVGAVIVHLRRGESREVLPSIVLLVLSVVVAWGRFGPYAF